MTRRRISKEAMRALKSVRGKRARIVIEHILKHGSITTEQLKDTYGYDHPPRAIRDVLDQGIPLEKTATTSKEGRRIAEYRLGDLTQIRGGRIGGRRQFPKAFKVQLGIVHDGRCAICHAKFELRALQVDHRVPYEVSGDKPGAALQAADFMLLCGSCNRAKSWSCEHCQNWVDLKAPGTCRNCYWASPQTHSHVAMHEIRRLDLSWVGDEVQDHDRLRAAAETSRNSLPEFVKAVLRRSFRRDEPETP